MFLRLATYSLIVFISMSAQGQTDRLCQGYQLTNLGFHTQFNPRTPKFEKSLIWKVSYKEQGEETVSYIMGSIHSDDGSIQDKMKVAIPLMATVDGLISEVQFNPGENLTGALTSEVSVSEQLGEDFLNLYKSVLKQHSLSMESFDKLKTWFNFSQLSRPKVSKFTLEKLFLDEALTIESYLGGLETTKSVISNVESMGADTQIEVLKEVLCNYELISSQNQKMIEAYAKGDLYKAYLAGHQFHSQDYERYTRFMDAVVFKRNIKIIEKLKVSLKKPALVMIGFSHLIGEKGILNGLSEDFKIEPFTDTDLTELVKTLSQQSVDLIKDKYLPKFQSFINSRGKYVIPEGSKKFPEIKFLPQTGLQDIACEGTPCPIFGLYDSKILNLTYELIPALIKGEPQRIGIAFHEYVHFVQEEYGDYSSVDAQSSIDWAFREKEAHILQRQYVSRMKRGATY